MRLQQSVFERMFLTFLGYNDMLVPYPKLGVLSHIPFGTHVTSQVGGLISTNQLFGALIVALFTPLAHKYHENELPPLGFVATNPLNC